MNIVHFIYGLKIGGAESFIKNLITSLSNNPEYNFFFILQDEIIENEFFNNLYKKNKDNFLFIPKFSSNPIKHYYSLRQILVKKRFDVMHVHMNSFVNPIPVHIGNKINLPVIVHSHNTSNAKGGLLGKVVHKLNRKLFNAEISLRLACGSEAGCWMFKNSTFGIINNAIPIEKYQYDVEKRIALRKKYNISDDAFVIGMVGRLHPQKNHIRGLSIFKEFHLIYPNSFLLILGNGPLHKELKNLTKDYFGEDKCVKFLGAIDEPAPYYSVFDIFLFPSLYEGLSVATIEAQSSGLPVVASDSVTKDIAIDNDVTFLSLNRPDIEWVAVIKDKIMNISKTKREDAAKRMKESKYSLGALGKQMAAVYGKFGLMKDH